MADFLRKIQGTDQEIRWLNPPEEHSEENIAEGVAIRQVVRLYDPDGHVIEVAGH